MTTTTPTARVVGAALAAVFLAVGAATAGVAVDGIDLPSPLAGPGVPAIKRSQMKKIDRGWRELAAGDLAESRNRAARAGDVPPARLLGTQIQLVEGASGVVDELIAFCDQQPGYAAAWITLSVAAELAGSELTALEAARRGAELWPDPPWGDRAAELSRRWVDDRIVAAQALFDAGDPGAALGQLAAANALQPNRPDAVLLAAEIFFSDGRLEQAEELVDSIPDDPDAVALGGRIAEALGDWQSAMDHYSSLPDGYPGKTDALARAKTRWRLTLLPAYARASMASEKLTRGDLAVVLVSVLPRLETLPGGEVPVMSDIVDYPGQREIIIVVRLGIMDADRRGHLFSPERPVAIDTVRKAIQRSRILLGQPPLEWCADENMVGSGCTSIPSPPSGGAVINAVLDSMSGVGP
jgi:tetratricopeptide (TPR) repeat protein